MSNQKELRKIAQEIRHIKSQLKVADYWSRLFGKAVKSFNRGNDKMLRKAVAEYLSGYMSPDMIKQWTDMVVNLYIDKPTTAAEVEEACDQAVANAF